MRVVFYFRFKILVRLVNEFRVQKECVLIVFLAACQVEHKSNSPTSGITMNSPSGIIKIMNGPHQVRTFIEGRKRSEVYYLT